MAGLPALGSMSRGRKRSPAALGALPAFLVPCPLSPAPCGPTGGMEAATCPRRPLPSPVMRCLWSRPPPAFNTVSRNYPLQRFGIIKNFWTFTVMVPRSGMKKNLGGRPPVEGEKRAKLVAFYLTETDYATLKHLAEKGGFRSTSSLITSLVEPVIQAKLSLRSSVQALSRVQRFMESNGAKFGATLADYREGMLQLFAPPPPTIPDEVLDISQLKADLRALLAELENQTKNNNNT